jgi:hypothetical protein
MTEVTTFTYPFVLPQIKMVAGFDEWCISNLPKEYGYQGNTGDPSTTTFTLYLSKELTTQELTDLTTLLQNHNDPAYWTTLAKVESTSLHVDLTNSTITIPLSTFIFCPNDMDNAKLDSLKILVQYHTPQLESFLNFDTESVNTITLELYCLTRNLLLLTKTVGINDILIDWKTRANNSETGAFDKWKTLQLYNLHSVITSFDCIWQFRLSVSNPLVYVALTSLERIFYEFHTN